jgi:hypothetical protein
MMVAPMPGPKYPLESLARVRDRRVDMAATDLARSSRAVEAAQRAHEVAESAQAKHRQAAEVLRRAEEAALAKGALRAADLALREAWRLRVQAESRDLQAQSAAARVTETRALDDERDAKARLAIRKVDADVVHEHHVRFDEVHQKRAEARDEEASLETWRPKR